MCKACRSTTFLSIPGTIELLDIARRLPSDNQPASDEQFSVFEEAASVIMSPAMDLDETIKVDTSSEVDNKYIDVGTVTIKKNKHVDKEQIIVTL